MLCIGDAFFDSDIKVVPFPPGTGTVRVMILLFSEVLHGPASFTVTLEVPEESMELDVMLGSPNEAVVYVPLPSDPVLSFYQERYIAYESDDFLHFTLLLSHPVHHPFIVELRTHNVSAFGKQATVV